VFEKRRLAEITEVSTRRLGDAETHGGVACGPPAFGEPDEPGKAGEYKWF
jgi:hypothetical protein